MQKIASFCIIRFTIILSEFRLWHTESYVWGLFSSIESFRAAILVSKCFSLFILTATTI